jgi:hypothetical protein
LQRAEAKRAAFFRIMELPRRGERRRDAHINADYDIPTRSPTEGTSCAGIFCATAQALIAFYTTNFLNLIFLSSFFLHKSYEERSAFLLIFTRFMI